MDIGDYLIAIATTFDRHDLSSPGHALLKSSDRYFRPLLPAGLLVKSGGGQGRGTFTPWIAILDPDETSSPQRGIYLVYLFSADLKNVWLSLNQGITEPGSRMGQGELRALLRQDATSIREATAGGPNTLVPEITLKSKGHRQRAYEAGNIAAVQYSISFMPEPEELESDLLEMVDLYQSAIHARQTLLLQSPGSLRLARVPPAVDSDPWEDFKPKSELDYQQQLSAKTILKSRRHEKLIREFGEHARAIGLSATTKSHPRDMLLARDDKEWLVEAKVLYRGNATHAVREALGQLATYEYLLYPSHKANKVALFTEPIGGAYTNLLEQHSIASIWKGELSWEGSSGAQLEGLF